MLVFIDESGCAGFKLDRGSTSHFVAAMVIFNDDDEGQRTDQAIEQLRVETRHKAEFKFSKCSWDVRDRFFEVVRPFSFRVCAIVVDKARLYSDHLRERGPVCNYFVQMMMKHDGGQLADAIVTIDGSGDREFRRELQKYLTRQLGEKIKKVRLTNSRGNNLIQLADMAVGAIHRHHREDRKDRSRWFEMLRPRVDDVWTFPNPGH